MYIVALKLTKNNQLLALPLMQTSVALFWIIVQKYLPRYAIKGDTNKVSLRLWVNREIFFIYKKKLEEMRHTIKRIEFTTLHTMVLRSF